MYERVAVENPMCTITEELCKISEVREEFQLGDGVSYESHADALEDNMSLNPWPDQYCIHRVDEKDSLLMTAKYIPPHELSVENLRVGLREMDFLDEVVRLEGVPPGTDKKLEHNAEQLTGSALTEEYHAMIREGLEYSYVSVELALILLRVPYEDPSTLYYYFCEPNMEVEPNDKQSFRQPKTAVARVLCLSLMSSLSTVHDQAWRNSAMAQLHTWTTRFEHVRSQIPEDELQQTPPDSQYTGSGSVGSQTGSELPIPLPLELPRDAGNNMDTQDQQHTARYCTQLCLLGLQQNGILDERCPNVNLHRQGQNNDQHQVNAEQLVSLLKQQVDKGLDHNCTPIARCGEYGAPFKVTCVPYGYTLFGKGTTTRLWTTVSRESDIYSILKKAQGAAVPVFLGPINLDKMYFLHGAGEIRHMLLIGWGGENLSDTGHPNEVQRKIRRTRKEVRSLGVVHGDFSHETMLWDSDLLWNSEMQRVLAIDFHRSRLDPRPKEKRVGGKRRKLLRTQTGESNRSRLARD